MFTNCISYTQEGDEFASSHSLRLKATKHILNSLTRCFNKIFYKFPFVFTVSSLKVSHPNGPNIIVHCLCMFHRKRRNKMVLKGWTKSYFAPIFKNGEAGRLLTRIGLSLSPLLVFPAFQTLKTKC